MRRSHPRRVLAVIAMTLASCAASAADAARPNVLFVMTDDHASHAMSCYGSRINATPNIDRIAAGGMRFDHCLVTNSICGPCRATILTGKYNHLNGFIYNGLGFDGGQQTFPKLLQAAGYQTAVVGKWHLKSDPTGFDHWNVLIGQGPYYNPTMKTAQGRTRHTGYTTDIITDLALDWLKTKRDADKPFMLMYQHKAPHRNWMPGPDKLTMYDGVDIPEPDTLFDDYAGRDAAKIQEMEVGRHMSPNDLKLVPPKGLTPAQLAAWNAAYGPKNEAFRKENPQGKDRVRWNYQRYMKDYLRCVSSVDDGVGKVLDYLDEAGLAENTIVVYTSDQGFYLGDHGWYDKRWMYEESLHTPLLVRWPGVVKPGSVNADLVSNLDFAETFLAAAGVDVPADMQGESLVPLLQGNTPADWRKAHYYRYYEFPAVHMVRQHYGVRTDRYKLMYFPTTDRREFYDLAEDPKELHNVADEPQYADRVSELAATLDRLRDRYKDDDTVRGRPYEELDLRILRKRSMPKDGTGR